MKFRSPGRLDLALIDAGHSHQCRRQYAWDTGLAAMQLFPSDVLNVEAVDRVSQAYESKNDEKRQCMISICRVLALEGSEEVMRLLKIPAGGNMGYHWQGAQSHCLCGC